jgi:hypothetical protein
VKYPNHHLTSRKLPFHRYTQIMNNKKKRASTGRVEFEAKKRRKRSRAPIKLLRPHCPCSHPSNLPSENEEMRKKKLLLPMPSPQPSPPLQSLSQTVLCSP